MSTTTAPTASTTGTYQLDPAPVSVRVTISALWATMLFVFAYVDLFSFFRPDFRADVESGVINGFAVTQSFLLATTAYVLLPTLMIVGALVLPPRVNRVANIALAIIYAVTIIGGAIGEWGYYVLGSAIEVALLAAIVFYAWTWPKRIQG
jgi:Family of unknown function (DUF6326)